MADDGLSQSMLEKERTLISKLYRTAIGWRVVDSNLASVLKVEGRKSPEREIFTDEQVTLILSQKNTPTGQMVIALLACGVRIYELLHFKHEDFHRTESGAYLIGGCKTEAGRNRIIPILDFGIPVFEHAYATSVENGPLFPNGKGGFWNEKNWRNRKFYPFLEEIGIQPNPYDENGKRKPEFAGKLATYTPYTTRHTYASLCDRAGVNKDILKRAGRPHTQQSGEPDGSQPQKPASDQTPETPQTRGPRRGAGTAGKTPHPQKNTISWGKVEESPRALPLPTKPLSPCAAPLFNNLQRFGGGE